MNLRKPTILYVDDERNNLVTFSASFRKYYQILSAQSAKEAIEILKKSPVDLIITDQRMPEMTGVQFLEYVLKSYPDPIRMILTGYTDIDAIKQSINEGSILRYITKPWDPDELKQIIDMGIRLHDLKHNQSIFTKNLHESNTQRSRAIELFKLYIDKNLADKIQELSVDTPLTTHGEYKSISLLSVDINNVSELYHADANDQIIIINKIQSLIVDIIQNNNGLVYSFLGQTIIITFGTTGSSTNCIMNAISSAHTILESIAATPFLLSSGDLFIPNILITIKSGDALCGYIVSEKSARYIIISEMTNHLISSERIGVPLKKNILIDKNTFDFLSNHKKIEVKPTHRTGEELFMIDIDTTFTN